MAVVAIPVLFNSYLAGAMSGLHVARQPILDAAGSLIQPADFARSVTVSENFATEEQATIFATSLPGSFVTALGGSSVTTVPSTAIQANAAQSLPVAAAILSASIFDGRSDPLTVAGAPAPASFFSVWANSIAVMIQAAINAPMITT